jgi:mono/diheme cytochrome c family protein
MWRWLLAMVALPASAADGAALFAQHCATCHQADASGTVGLAPSLKGEHWSRLAADRRYLASVLVHGLSGAIKVGSENFVGSMPPFGPQLDDEALAAVATQLRRLQGAPDDRPYAAAEIRSAREQPGSPPQTRQMRARILDK